MALETNDYGCQKSASWSMLAQTLKKILSNIKKVFQKK